MAAGLAASLSRLSLSSSHSPHHQESIRRSSAKPGVLLPFSSLGNLNTPSINPIATSCGWGSFTLSSSRNLWGITRFNAGTYNVKIMVEENEPEEALLRRFRREVSKAGIIQECKRRRFFENKQDQKKRKAREAGRRNRRRRSMPPRVPSSTEEDSARSKKTADDEDDNWDLPEGDLSY